MDALNDYVVGRGKVYFDKFLPGTLTGTGERYLGNTPSFSMATTVTNLDHFSSDFGIKEKDKAINLQVENTVTLSCDNLQFENFGLWYLGDVLTENVAAETALTQTVYATPGSYYQLGATDDRPEGLGFVTSVVATTADGTKASGSYTLTGQPTADTDTVTIGGTAITFKASGATGNQVNIGASKEATAQALRVFINANPSLLVTADAGSDNVVNLKAITPGTAGNSITTTKSSTNITVSGATLSGGAATTTIDAANFDINLETGRVQILEDAADVTLGDMITFTFNTTVISDRIRVVAAGDAIYGALRYVADNATGDNKDQYIPYCKIAPDGALALKGDTWVEMSFTMEALKKTPTTPRVIVTQGASAS